MSNIRRHFPNIDILRGFAALSVVIYHIIEIYPWPDFLVGNPIGNWFRIGWMGVDLFFVISGFVIALSAFGILDKTAPAPAAEPPSIVPKRTFMSEFMRRRLARILPLYFATGLAFIIFSTPAILFEPSLPKHLLTHLTFTHNFFVSTHGSINGANWSVGTEMQFYLFVMLAAPLLRRVPAWLIVAIGCFVSWGWRAACYVYLRKYLHVDDSFPLFVSTTQLPGMLEEFFLGIALAKLICDDHSGKFFNGLVRWRWALLALCVGIVWGSATVFWGIADYWKSGYTVVFWRTMLAVSCFSVLVVACAFSSKLLVTLTAPLRYLGTISYGIYLWHLPIMLAIKTVPLGDPLRYTLYVLPVLLLTASLSWHFFEKPLLDKYSTKRSKS